jgi:hypothetical protein
MKRILTLSIILCTALIGFAQIDTTGKQTDTTGKQNEVDTIKVGGMIIIRKHGENEISHQKKEKSEPYHHHYYKSSNLSTNWWIIDFGFSNFNDQTNYSSQEAKDFAPGTSKEAFRPRTWKSRNMNIWLFMQRLNMIKHVVNLKYGFGLELNNYFFDDERIHMYRNPTQIKIDTSSEWATVDKNKLAADYLTVPMMLNFNFTPDRARGFGVSFGVSAGLLYSSRQKIKDNGDVSKTHDDFDLRKWKISYIGEVLLGPIKLYGSYATQSMWEKGLDQTPYTVGLRFSY